MASRIEKHCSSACTDACVVALSTKRSSSVFVNSSILFVSAIWFFCACWETKIVTESLRKCTNEQLTTKSWSRTESSDCSKSEVNGELAENDCWLIMPGEGIEEVLCARTVSSCAASRSLFTQICRFFASNAFNLYTSPHKAITVKVWLSSSLGIIWQPAKATPPRGLVFFRSSS